MLKNLLSLSHLPVSLPESAYDQLARVVGYQAVSTCPWITLSLVHSSYVNEHPLDFDKAGISISTLNLIGRLGAEFGRLALFHLAYENPRVQTPGDAASFVAKPNKDAFQRIAEDLRLADVAFWGKSASRQLGNIRSRQRFLYVLGRQFLGAVRICSTYKTLFSLVETSIKASRKVLAPVVSYKSVLQEHSQGRGWGLPEYEIIGETGPDHNKLFHIRVRTRDGKWAEGEGRSKKRAGEAAARQYMEKFASHYLAKRIPSAPATDVVQKHPPHVPPELHRREVEDLCKRFKISSNKMALLSQALVHSSFLHETPLKNCQDNRMLAQLGSQVLITIATEVVVSRLLEPTSKVNDLKSFLLPGTFCDSSAASKGFDFLELEKALLVGRGHKDGLTDSIKADAFQAVLAAVFITRGTLEDVETFLPSGLFHWLTSSIQVHCRLSLSPTKPSQPRVHVRHITQPMIRARPKQQPDFTRLQNQVRTELASPDFKEGTRSLADHCQDLKQFLDSKWQDITSIERSFGLAQDQVYEVKVAVGPLNRLGVERLRFRQQGFTPPAVGVDIVMQHEVVCQCALDVKGRLQHHQELDKLFPADYQLLLNLAAVVHYADLVVPRESKRLQPAIGTTEISRSQSSPEGTTKEPPQSVRTKRIPRPKPSTTSHRTPRSRGTATNRPTLVDPFRRRLPAGQKPSFAKIVEADQAGISLQGPSYPEVQYTFVRAHMRGGGNDVPQYVYADYQAVKTFETLLNVLGFP